MRAGLVACFTMIAAAASASTIQVTSPAGLIANGLLDWGGLGPAFTPVANNTAVGVTGVPGLTATVSESGTSLERRDQGTGWQGNFADGSELLWTGLGPTEGGGPITLVFSAPIYGFGAFIESDFMGSYVAQIAAFDASSNSLGVFTVGGVQTLGGGVAPFLGILSSSADISRIVYSLTVSPGLGQDLAISNGIVQTQTAVPEPASLLLLGTGLVGVATRYRRRK